MREIKDKEQVMKEMDEASKEAQVELLKGFKSWSCVDTAHWWQRWYLKAGHKRLGRLLVGLSKTLNAVEK
jgi:hypothetical protein